MSAPDNPNSSTNEIFIEPTEINKFALVIGVNNSNVSPYLPSLKYAENAAYEVFKTLEHSACKFELVSPVLLGDRAGTDAVRSAVIQLAKKKADQDFLLFYFIGHAQPMKTKAGNNDIYFVTHNFSEEEVKEDAEAHLSMRWLRKMLYQPHGAGRVLIILDCCYAGNMIYAESDPSHIHIDVNVRKIVEECFNGSSITHQNGHVRIILTATGYNTLVQEKDGYPLMTGLLLQALQGKIQEALDYYGDVNIHSLYMYLQGRMPQELFPNLSGEFARKCILASYPHLSELVRQEAQRDEEHRLKHEVSKLTDKVTEISRIITDPDYFKRLAATNTYSHIQQFDRLLAMTASTIDLNQERVAEFFKRERVQIQDDYHSGVSPQEQLQHFTFLQDLFPTYGVLLSFGLNPTKWVAGAFTRCTRWLGNDRNHGWLEAQDYQRDLVTQFELSRDFLRKNLRLTRTIGRNERAEELEIPLVALQEALANALVHREYMNQTSAVYVDIFDKRIEICSPGIPPEPMTLELLEEEHKSHPRNPQIARIFYLYGYVEKAGSGIHRMQWAMERAGLPLAKFEVGKDKIFKVVFLRPEHLLEDVSPAQLEVPLETKSRYAVCIGVNRPHSLAQEVKLQYAEDDARAFHTLLIRSGFAPEQCCLLTGEEATQQAIQDALVTFLLAKARRDDLVIFYFAGHNLLIDLPNDEEDEPHRDFFLAAQDLDRDQLLYDRGAWLKYPLRLGRLRSEFFEATPSKKVLFLFDTCYSADLSEPSYYLDQSFSKMSSGRVVLSSCLPQQVAREDEQLGHGLFTYHLLKALSGRVPEAVEHDGWVTTASLFNYLSDALPLQQRPMEAGVELGSLRLLSYPEYAEPSLASIPQDQEQKRLEREHRLKAMLPDQSSFLRDRLNSFVGRIRELEELRQRIAGMLPVGGYLTITGQAGQGKSSIIAKLVEEYGPENVAFHFVPINPGQDHTVGLLRNLMARLILKYDLSDLYVASESRPALRNYFPKVLIEVVARGGQEVIFIDGLDLLEEDLSRVRDLSFLPNNPPPGVVFVLGTRPNDTLRPLELLKPHYEYKLPNLGRQDFGLILQHHRVQLDRRLADRFYAAMQENALYLDLVARELAEETISSPEDVIQRIADNPENIFSLSMERLKQHAQVWREVLKPILGVLLVAREPLGTRHIRQILGVDDDQLKEGLRRLGGLIAQDGQQRYALFHLKLSDYLRQDENRPDKKYMFATDEEESWHKHLVNWCERGNIVTIWEDVKRDPTEQGRREYARKYYIAHLYYAHEWHQLFAALDEGAYGQAKVRYDSSMRSYAQDLDLGRQAAGWEQWTLQEGVGLLPSLWRYTLLRCSLASRADRYPLAAFKVLVLMGREHEALGLAELLTHPAHKLEVLLEIGEQLGKQTNREQDCIQILFRAREVVSVVEESKGRAEALSKLGVALARAQQWEQAKESWAEAEAVTHTIEQSDLRAQALSELSKALAQTQQWEHAKQVIATIQDGSKRAEALSVLSAALAQDQQGELAKRVWDEAKQEIATIQDSSRRAEVLSALGTALAQAQHWRQANEVWTEAEAVTHTIEQSDLRAQALSELSGALAKMHQWERAETVIRSIKENNRRVEALSKLSEALAQAQQWDQAKKAWAEAETIINTIDENNKQSQTLPGLSEALAQAQQWDQAEEVWKGMGAIARVSEENDKQAQLLKEQIRDLAQAQQWDQAELQIYIIEEKYQALALSELTEAIVMLDEHERLLHLVQRWWKQASTRKYAVELLPMASGLIPLNPEIGTAFHEAFIWVNAFLKG